MPTWIRKAAASVPDDYRSPIRDSAAELGTARLADESQVDKWRIWQDLYQVPIGAATRRDNRLVLCVSPGEWIVIGARPEAESVDLSHVRAAIRVAGAGARTLLQDVCALDLSDEMMPNGAAARAPVAGVATELVRDDEDTEPSYLLLVSRSFAESVWERLRHAAGDQ